MVFLFHLSLGFIKIGVPMLYLSSLSLLPLPKTRNINEKSMEESEERRRRQQKHDLVLWVIGFIFLLLLQSCHSLVSSLGLAVTSDEKWVGEREMLIAFLFSSLTAIFSLPCLSLSSHHHSFPCPKRRMMEREKKWSESCVNERMKEEEEKEVNQTSDEYKLNIRLTPWFTRDLSF